LWRLRAGFVNPGKGERSAGGARMALPLKRFFVQIWADFGASRNPPVIPVCENPSVGSTFRTWVRMASLRKIIDRGLKAALSFARREDGGPASEFALMAPVFIVLIFATAQIAIIYLANAYLETAAEDAARLVLTNQTSGMTATQFQAALCNNITALFTCSNVVVSLTPATSTTSISTTAPSFNSNGSLATPLPYTQPSPGQIAVLEVLYQWPVIGLPLGFNFSNLGNGTYLMMSTQVFMVEPQ
jgi:Flp pilus assembly protein TadG